MKIIRILIYTIAITLFAVTLTGCDTTEQSYTLRFETNGGSTIDSLSTDGNSLISIPNNPTKTGFYFDGWYWDNDVWADAVTVNSLLDSPITNDRTIYAKWNVDNTVTILFNSNGGSTVASVSTDSVSTISLPTDPTKAGFDFDGWYWDNDSWIYELMMGDSLLNAPTPNNLTVYAKWNVDNTVTILFNSNGGSTVASVSTDSVSTISLPTDPTKAGFDFDGWYWDNDSWIYELMMGDSLLNAPTPNNLTVYAKWTEITLYTVIFDSNGGNNINNITTDGVTTFPMPSNPTKDGFEFDGWFKDEDVWANKLLAETMFDNASTSKEIYLYAKWNETIIYTIIFDTNGADNINNITTDGFSTFPMPSNPTKDGFEFDGWFKDEDVWANKLLAETMFDNVPTSNIINLYAKWIEITYKVTLDVNGGNALDISTLVLSIGDNYTLPVPKNLESIFFVGWFSALTDGNKLDLFGQWSIKEDITLYAMWSPYLRVNDYIYFGSYPQTLKSSGVTITTTTPDTDGYYLGSDGSRYAKVVSTPFKQDYKFSDDSNVVEGTTNYFIVMPLQWRILEENNGIALIMSTMGIDNLKYDGNSNSYEDSEVRAWLNDEFYNKAFTAYHNALIETMIIDNSTATLYNPDSLFASADTFDNITLLSYQDMLNPNFGFNSDPNFSDPMRKIVVSDYVRSKGGVMSTHTVLNYYEKGYVWLRSPNEVRTAHFVGFEGCVGHSPIHYYVYEVAPVLRIQLGDITLHTITLDLDGGVGTETITALNHSDLNLTDEPTKDNYIFGAWYYDDAFTSIATFPLTIDKDITLYVQWVNINTLTFDSDGGTVIDATSQSSITDIYAPTEPLKDGYTFRGWFYEDTFDNAVIYPITVDENTTIYAKWTAIDTAAYVRIDITGINNSSGDYILFGEYPQTNMEDSVLITSQTPNSDGYYLGSDGERYAKVVASPFSENITYTYNFSNGNEILDGTTYYFKVEPIKWRILEENDGSVLILSEMLLDNHRYDDNSNNYAESEIRLWLNNQFYLKAFNDYQTAIIEITLVDNSLSTTAYPDLNNYTCEDTNDKIFLLSYTDMKRAGYGFKSDDSMYDPVRQRLASDYTRSMGAYFYAKDDEYYGNGKWYLRTPSYYGQELVLGILYYGDNQDELPANTVHHGGIVPALIITLN